MLIFAAIAHLTSIYVLYLQFHGKPQRSMVAYCHTYKTSIIRGLSFFINSTCSFLCCVLSDLHVILLVLSFRRRSRSYFI
ncbi:hypothetical protein BDZ97DRAFT_1847292 [Flammula alnicola]|nr:hypothetical protein BDZ97DRAFT_1847292 [Flammula alnicola]